MMIPEAWENSTRDGPGAQGVLRVPRPLMEPWDGPAAIAFTDGTRDRRGPRPQRPAPEPLLGHRRRPGRDGQRGRRARHPGRRRSSPRAGCSRAGCSWSTPPQGRIVDDAGDQGASWPPRTRTTSGCTPASSSSADAARCARASSTRTSRCSAASSSSAYTEEELRILVAPMARAGAEPIGSMGTDTPIAVLSRAAAAAVRLLHPAVRPGHQPAAGRDPRGAGHLLRRHHRARRATCSTPARPAAGRSCCRSRSSATTSWPRSSASTTTATCRASRRSRSAASTTSPGVRRRCEARLERSSPRSTRRSRTAPGIIVLSDRDSDQRLGADPVAAAHLRRAPPPDPREDPYPGRPRRRVRRRARGAPRRAAARLRRRGGQSLPRLRVGRGPGRQRRPRPASTADQAGANLVKALGKGVLKVMSQDGHQHGRVLHRRAGLRGDRPVQELVDQYFTGTAAGSSGVGLDVIAAEVAARHCPRLPRQPRRAGATAASRSAASTSGAARASCTCSTRRRSSSCSTPPAPSATTSSGSTPRGRRAVARRRATLRGLFELRHGRAAAGADRRGRAGQRDRQAVRHRRDVATARSAPRRTRRSRSR